jgi:hypothetical protein
VEIGLLVTTRMSSQGSNKQYRRRWFSPKAKLSPLSKSPSTIVPIINSVHHDDIIHHDDDVLFNVNEVQRRTMIRQKLSMISDDIVIRFFRRSFYYALVVEDPTMAYLCYTATRSDFDNHFISMVQYPNLQSRNESSERTIPNVSGFYDFKRNVDIHSPTCTIQEFEATSTSMAPHLRGARCGDTTLGLLQRFMNPSDQFETDDFYDPYNDAYGDMDECDDKGQPYPNLIIATLITDALFQRHDDGKVKSGFLRQQPIQRIHSAIMTKINEHSTSAKLINCYRPVVDELLATTPIHEVARLGHVPLLELMFRHKNLDCDVRNGCGRTILHCAAGGLIGCETHNTTKPVDADTSLGTSQIVEIANQDDNVLTTPVGICAPRYPIEIVNDTNEKERTLTQRTTKLIANAARGVSAGRWIPRVLSNRNANENSRSSHVVPLYGQQCSSDKSKVEKEDRIKAVLAILHWKKLPFTDIDDDSEEVFADNAVISFSTFDSFQGVSINAVDTALNRTALHYAAELGRTEICQSMLSFSYGTMLTIVDTLARTPCELAALQNHKKLSSYLEARALLHVDPYGTEEDLLNSVSIVAAYSQNDNRNSRILQAPFSCYETITLDTVAKHREQLIQEAMDLMYFITSEALEEQTLQLAKAPICAKEIEAATNDKTLLFEAVFDADTTEVVDNDPNHVKKNDTKNYSCRIQELNSLQIGIHEGHIEKYLAFHKWIVADALLAFRKDPIDSFQTAKVPVPKSLSPIDFSIQKLGQLDKQICLICCDEFDSKSKDWIPLRSCEHGFCKGCIEDYVATATSLGFVVECPHHGCTSLLSRKEILDETPPSSDVYNQRRRSAIDAFIVSSHSYAYCPHPGCCDNAAIHLLQPKHVSSLDGGFYKLFGAVCTNFIKIDRNTENIETLEINDESRIVTYEGVQDPRHFDIIDMVQPNLAHRFCFQCGDERIHWPVTCSLLQEWKTTILEHVGEHIHDGSEIQSDLAINFNEVAQKLWMKANTRPCPKVSILSF